MMFSGISIPFNIIFQFEVRFLMQYVVLDFDNFPFEFSLFLPDHSNGLSKFFVAVRKYSV